MSRQFTTAAGIFCWLLLTASGVVAFWRYELTAGGDHGVPHRWPTNSEISSPYDTASLVMFVHPQCACTKAGLVELKALLDLSNLPKQPRITFILLQPQQSSPNWVGSPNETLCRQFNNGRVFYDSNGVETQRFGVATSGMCLLYSAEGDLVFSGGVTASRGHQGPNLGKDFLQNALESDHSTYHEFPVFGCPLVSSTRPDRQVAINR